LKEIRNIKIGMDYIKTHRQQRAFGWVLENKDNDLKKKNYF